MITNRWVFQDTYDAQIQHRDSELNALTRALEPTSETNIQEARDEHPPHAIQSIANTSVLALRYRTRVESRWR